MNWVGSAELALSLRRVAAGGATRRPSPLVAAGRHMRLESFVKIATLLGVGALLLVGQGLQPKAAYPAWVSASDAARYAAAAAEMANGAAEVAYSAATEAASSVTEAASSALGLQSDGEDPNAMALAGFHASRADLNRQLQERIQAAAAAATGQAPAATASATASAATGTATPTPPKPERGADGSVVMEAATTTATAATTAATATVTVTAPAKTATAMAMTTAQELYEQTGEVQGEPAWLLRASNSSALLLNAPARAALSAVAQPAGTTLHFTFGRWEDSSRAVVSSEQRVVSSSPNPSPHPHANPHPSPSPHPHPNPHAWAAR
eukprot:scaffold40885_cov44-Phaeocystis_antarctica.AAC.2